MTTNTQLLAPQVARVPQSESTYRLVRHFEPDEVARDSSAKREANFRRNELDQLPVAGTLGAAAVLGSIMFLAAHYGVQFLASTFLLQVALAGAALYGTRRVFALMVGRTKAGAYYNGGDFRRHITMLDLSGGMILATLLIAQTALTPLTQGIAVAGALIALLIAHRASVKALRNRLQEKEFAAQQELLTASA